MLNILRIYFQGVSVKKSSIRFGLVSLILAGGIATTFAANIILSPSTITTKVGKTFSVDVLVSNNKDAINAASGLITFPSDVLSVASISKSGSFITLWAEEPSFSNTNGTVNFEGVALNPGFSGSSGKVVTITFKAKQAGNVNILVKSGSVLANDGNATNVLGTTGQAFVVINEDAVTLKPEVATDEVKAVPVNRGQVPEITSTTYPDVTKWYNSKEASFEWKVPSGVIAVRTLYGDKENSTPTKVYDPPISNRSFTADTDGIMYMHVQFKDGNGWGTVAHYKFQVDTEGPEKLSASFPDGAVSTSASPAILVNAVDSLSGVDHILISIDGGTKVSYPIDPAQIYHLPRSSPGKHTATISAVDAAGNSSNVALDFTIQAISIPIITEYTRTVDFDNQMKVIGTTYPQAIVEVTLTNRDGIVITETTTANDAGGFTLIWGKKIDTGVYEMRARSIDPKGSSSEYTESKVVVAEHIALVRFGIFVMNWLSVILILIIGGMLVSATFWYSFVQFSRFRRKVRRTITEVENTLKVNVAALRRDTEEFHTILVKAEKKRALTKEEEAILKKFKKRLEITEKEIDQKLEQII